MSTPQRMRREYEQASLLSRVQVLLRNADDDADADDGDVALSRGNAHGKRLLLIHGLLDDNVHSRHVFLLLQVVTLSSFVPMVFLLSTVVIT
jgi:hypothetical protein